MSTNNFRSDDLAWITDPPKVRYHSLMTTEKGSGSLSEAYETLDEARDALASDGSGWVQASAADPIAFRGIVRLTTVTAIEVVQ